jgi:hypothetical protein
MEGTPPPYWLIWVAFAWVVFVVLLSVFYRRRAGKPIFPKVPHDVRYVEKSASGPFASNCLMVWVTDDTLAVVPRFPFNLMFLPEVYRLERSIPLNAIRDVEQRRMSASNVIITYGGDGKKVRLRMKQPAMLVAALRRP